MGENSTGKKQEINRSHAVALLRFFSVDSADVSIPSANQEEQHNADGMLPLADLWSKEFVLKVIQLLTGFVCIAIYSEGLKFLKNSIYSMMFPNTVFSSFVIITSVILLSTLLGCAMRDVLIRIFNILGMILYFAAATVILYESVVRVNEDMSEDMMIQRKLLFGTSVISYFNSVIYAVDVYFSVKKAISFEPKY